MKILVDCRCLNYPFLTGVNAYTIRLLHCLCILKASNTSLKIISMGLNINRTRELMSQFPFILDLFENRISLAQYQNYQDSIITQSSWFHKLLEVKLIIQNWFDKKLNDSKLETYDYVILPQPRLLRLHPDSKLVTIFHDIFSILDNQKHLPQSLILNKYTCQSLVDRSYKVIAGSISTCQDINKTFFNQNNFGNPKIKLIYPALPNLQELRISKNTETRSTQNANQPIKIPNLPFILAISGIEPRKNWHNLLLAHKYLQKKYDWQVALVLSGSLIDQTYYKKLLQIIQNNQIQNVVWQINISDDEKQELIKNCEFVVYPSYYEGFGFPILESLEYDKVAVTSRISSMPEIGKTACIYVNPFSHISIANSIYLLHIDKRFKIQIKGNINKVKSHYCWKEMTQALSKLLV